MNNAPEIEHKLTSAEREVNDLHTAARAAKRNAITVVLLATILAVSLTWLGAVGSSLSHNLMRLVLFSGIFYLAISARAHVLQSVDKWRQAYRRLLKSDGYWEHLEFDFPMREHPIAVSKPLSTEHSSTPGGAVHDLRSGKFEYPS